MSDRPANTETELKLSLRPEDLPHLRAAPVLKTGASDRPVTRTLESIYFDTPDRHLLHHRVAFRVRRQGRTFIQTLKSAADPAEGLARGEWEWPVTKAAPDLLAIDDPAVRTRLGPVTAEDLKPVFTSHIERTIHRLKDWRPDGAADACEAATIEVALDHGAIRSSRDGAAVPVCEVELELKQGPARALYELALALNAVVPLRVEPRTKAARGYALAFDTADDGAVKADRLELDPAMTVETVMTRIVRTCLTHMTANEACALRGLDPEGIHQMRVALRRLRSALGLFRPLLPADQYADLGGAVKELAGAMGPARDWDVFLDELFAPIRAAFTADRHQGAALATLEAAARASRDDGYATARQAILSPRYTALLLRFGVWLEGRGWRVPATADGKEDPLSQPVIAWADTLLAKRHKKARKIGADFAGLAPAERHQVRIALKKLRYAVEFFRSLYEEKAVRRYLLHLTALQDVLGHLNDVATASRLMAQLQDGATLGADGGHAAGLVIGWHGRGAADQEPHLVEQWGDFTKAKPFWARG